VVYRSKKVGVDEIQHIAGEFDGARGCLFDGDHILRQHSTGRRRLLPNCAMIASLHDAGTIGLCNDMLRARCKSRRKTPSS
jgi:hypothetical protein